MADKQKPKIILSYFVKDGYAIIPQGRWQEFVEFIEAVGFSIKDTTHLGKKVYLEQIFPRVFLKGMFYGMIFMLACATLVGLAIITGGL